MKSNGPAVPQWSNKANAVKITLAKTGISGSCGDGGSYIATVATITKAFFQESPLYVYLVFPSLLQIWKQNEELSEPTLAGQTSFHLRD
jgi:hypothetical protein